MSYICVLSTCFLELCQIKFFYDWSCLMFKNHCTWGIDLVWFKPLSSQLIADFCFCDITGVTLLKVVMSLSLSLSLQIAEAFVLHEDCILIIKLVCVSVHFNLCYACHTLALTLLCLWLTTTCLCFLICIISHTGFRVWGFVVICTKVSVDYLKPLWLYRQCG